MILYAMMPGGKIGIIGEAAVGKEAYGVCVTDSDKNIEFLSFKVYAANGMVLELQMMEEEFAEMVEHYNSIKTMVERNKEGSTIQ